MGGEEQNVPTSPQETAQTPPKTTQTPPKPHIPSLFRLTFQKKHCLGVRSTHEVDLLARFLFLRGVSFKVKVVKKRRERQIYVFLLVGVDQ